MVATVGHASVPAGPDPGCDGAALDTQPSQSPHRSRPSWRGMRRLHARHNGPPDRPQRSRARRHPTLQRCGRGSGA